MFKNSDRRNDLDKAYHHLIRVLFENVERMAEEHQKTPRAVVMMGKSAGGGRVGFSCLLVCTRSTRGGTCTRRSVLYCTISLYRRVILADTFLKQQ